MVWLAVGLMLISFRTWAQPGTPPLPEKIYVQSDSKVYTKDQTIWLKAIVTDAAYHIPSRRSRVLYVELIGPTEEIVDSKILNIENGFGDGHFDLRQQYAEGTYLIRAYTQWDQNFGSDFFFHTYIQVLSTSTEEPPNPISQLTLLEKEDNKRILQAQFDPLSIDDLHTRKLKVIITLDDTKDTLFVKQDREDAYRLDYEVPKACNFVTLQMQTENGVAHSQTLVLDEAYLDVQFFPESGDLVHGLPCKVGFKALDANGKGMHIEGEIVTQSGEWVTQFNSNELGMGYFFLPQPDSSLTYTARINSQVEKGLTFTYPLPAVVKRGNRLSVVKQGENIRIMAVSNYLKQDSLYVRASCRGVGYFEVKGRLADGQLMFSLPVRALPEGIIAFTLTDAAHQPIAERLFFNERPETRIHIGISMDKESYVQREQTTVQIETTTPQQEAVPAHVSLHVINQEQLGQMSTSQDHILSYFLLSSDLKGTIENPRFYFQEDSNRHQDLEALMLTQGWRRYNYTRPIEAILHQPETTLSVSGTIKGGVLQRRKKEVDMTLVTMGEPRTFQVQTLDSLGAFYFEIADEFGEDLEVLLQTADGAGKNKQYTIELEQRKSPSIVYEQIQSIVTVDSTIQELVQNNLMRKKIKDAFRVSDEGITLDEVVIEGYQMTPQRQRALDNFGKPRVVISGKEIQSKEEKWSSGLFSVLKFHYPDKIKIVHQGNNLYARVIGSPSIEPGDGVTLIAIDGALVGEGDYPLIAGIPPSEVKSVEIIQSAKSFAKHYMDVVPGTHALEAPRFGSILAIYTHAGKGLFSIQQPVGLLHATVPVFAEPSEFYAPKYPDPSSYNWAKPDLRALVHWEPRFETDSTGKATAIFYNADNLGEMRVIVEAISENGDIGYQELMFRVEKYAD